MSSQLLTPGRESGQTLSEFCNIHVAKFKTVAELKHSPNKLLCELKEVVAREFGADVAVRLCLRPINGHPSVEKIIVFCMEDGAETRIVNDLIVPTDSPLLCH